MSTDPKSAPRRASKPQAAADVSTSGENHTHSGPADRPAACPIPPGQLGRFGDYRLLKLLGQGGMGYVYHAEDTALGRPVALKVMRPEIAAKPSARERFLREGRAAAKLKNDHVVTIYAVGETDGVPFMALEYLVGATLEDWLRKHGTSVAAPQVVKVARDVLKGLVAAHEKDLIHRDIKPANLWLEKGTNRVKLLDFGLTHEVGADHVTADGTVVGTPAYMAPEQARCKEVDARTDLFSLGVVLHRMVGGKSPFQRGELLATLAALALDDAPPLTEVSPGFSAEVSAFVARLMSKDPADRPATPAVALAELAAVEKSLKASSSNPNLFLPAPTAVDPTAFDFGDPPAPPAKPKTAPAPALPPTAKSKRPLVIGGSALAAVLITGAIVFSLTGGKRPTAEAKPTAPPRNVPDRPAKQPPSKAAIPPPKQTDAEVLTSDAYVWADPQPLGKEINTVDHQVNPTLTADGLCMMFNRKAGQFDLCESRRGRADEPFGNATPLPIWPGVDKKNPWLSPDGLWLVFQADAAAGGRGQGDLYETRRPTRDGAWQEPRPVPGVNTEYDEADPWLTADGLHLYFVSNRPGGKGGHDIWVASRKAVDAPFDALLNLKAVNTARDEARPCLSPDGSALAFSYRLGTPAPLMMLATRDRDRWAVAPLRMAMAHSTDRYPTLTPDGRTCYFSSDRYGRTEIFASQRVVKPASPTPVRPPTPTAMTVRPLRELPGRWCAFSADGTQALVQGTVYDVTTGVALRELVPSSKAQKLTFTPDWSKAAWVTDDQQVVVFDVAAQTELVRLPADDVQNIALDNAGKRLAVTRGTACVVLDIATRNPVTTFDIYKNQKFGSLAFSPSGKWLAVGRWQFLDLHDPDTGLRLKRAAPVAQAWVGSVRFSPDEQYVVGVEDRSTLSLPRLAFACAIADSADMPRIDLPGESAPVFAGRPGKALVVRNGKLFEVDLRTGDPSAAVADVDSDSVLAATPDGRLLATGANNKTIKLWEVTSPGVPTAASPAPPTATPDVSPDRRVAEQIGPHVRLLLKMKGDRRLTVDPGQPLPEEPFTVLNVEAIGSRRLPDDVKASFWATVAPLANVEAILDRSGMLGGLTVPVLTDLAATPCGRSLRLLVGFQFPYQDRGDALGMFPNLLAVRFIADGASVTEGNALTALPPNLLKVDYYGYGQQPEVPAAYREVLKRTTSPYVGFEKFCPGRPENVAGVVRDLAAMPTLRVLRFSADIDADAVGRLAALAAAPALRVLMLDLPASQEVPADDLKALAAALPACTVAYGNRKVMHYPTVAPGFYTPAVGQPLDLVAATDVGVHSRNHLWTKDARGIVSPPLQFSSLEVPVVPAAAYRLEAYVERLDGDDSFSVGLVCGDRPARLVLDACGDRKLSGLSDLNGKHVSGQPAAAAGAILSPGRPVTLVIDVRPDAITATADGVRVVDWRGDPHAVSDPDRKGYYVGPGRLFLGSNGGRFRVGKCVYTALPG